MAKRQQFTKEFKLEAVRLWESSGKPAAAIARELGLRRNHLYKWQEELETHGEAAFPGKGGRAHSTDEFTRLLREHVRLREERDIYKKPRRSLRGNRHEIPVHSDPAAPASD